MLSNSDLTNVTAHAVARGGRADGTSDAGSRNLEPVRGGRTARGRGVGPCGWGVVSWSLSDANGVSYLVTRLAGAHPRRDTT